jgi:tellurite resistance protein TehA-like permease
MGNFFSLNFWINTRPGSLSPFGMQVLTFFAVLMIALFFLTKIMQKKKGGLYFKLFDKLNSFFIANFLICLMYMFFTYELIPLLSARFWFLFWIIGMIVWLYFIFKHMQTIPEKKKKLEEKQEFEKYIP